MPWWWCTSWWVDCCAWPWCIGLDATTMMSRRVSIAVQRVASKQGVFHLIKEGIIVFILICRLSIWMLFFIDSCCMTWTAPALAAFEVHGVRIVGAVAVDSTIAILGQGGWWRLLHGLVNWNDWKPFHWSWSNACSRVHLAPPVPPWLPYANPETRLLLALCSFTARTSFLFRSPLAGCRLIFPCKSCAEINRRVVRYSSVSSFVEWMDLIL